MYKLMLVGMLAAAPLVAFDSCRTAQSALQLVRLTDKETRKHNLRHLKELVRLLCTRSGGEGVAVRYSNGQLATLSKGTDNVPWYYPNGKPAILLAGNENFPFYYPNGGTFSNLPGNLQVAWSYPNGKVFSSLPGNTQLPWMWPNGVVLAQLPGSSLSWYYSDGTIAFERAPIEVTDRDMERRPHEVLRKVADLLLDDDED